ncbi:trypsin-like serine protease [Kineococcus sp. TBRC 1896]|uniref:Trypsin-like serine protease n=1 Tax=Kineococcus mangrovi TaxID=1660183 RepID=A0ABV4HXL5_9ACTN
MTGHLAAGSAQRGPRPGGGWTPVVATLALVAAFVSAVVGAGPAQAVVGGSTASTGTWSVRVYEDDEPICTGVLVDRRWVLTAGHCVRFDNSDITFRVGNLDQREGEVVPRLPGRTFFAANADVALVQIPEVTTRPIRLPAVGSRQDRDLPVRTRLSVFGWGATCEPDEATCQSDRLRTASVRIIAGTETRCDYLAGTEDYCVSRGTGLPVGGDSGGPATIDGPCGPLLAGILAASDRTDTAAYANVHRLRPWITATIGR